MLLRKKTREIPERDFSGGRPYPSRLLLQISVSAGTAIMCCPGGSRTL